MTQPRILVVDDEQPIVELVRSYLAREGFDVASVGDGREAVEQVRTWRPDVVVLDVMLPGLDGFEVLRTVRTFSDAYVIMLTARAEEVDRIVGLSVGADDYLVKPFSPRELVARVKALLRRPRSGTALVLPRDVEIDVARRTVTVGGASVALTATEFEILALLAREPGVVVSRPELLSAVWGPGYDDDHLVDVHVANLRRKVGVELIETVRRVGYKLATDS